MRTRINPFFLLKRPEEVENDTRMPTAETVLAPIKLTEELLAACRNVDDLREVVDRDTVLDAKNLAERLPHDTASLSRKERHDLADYLQETSIMRVESAKRLAEAEKILCGLVLAAVAENTKLSRSNAWAAANATREAATDRQRRRDAEKKNTEDCWGYVVVVNDDNAWIAPRSGKDSRLVPADELAKLRRPPRQGDRVQFRNEMLIGIPHARDVIYLHPQRPEALYPEDQPAVERANVVR